MSNIRNLREICHGQWPNNDFFLEGGGVMFHQCLGFWILYIVSRYVEDIPIIYQLTYK